MAEVAAAALATPSAAPAAATGAESGAETVTSIDLAQVAPPAKSAKSGGARPIPSLPGVYPDADPFPSDGSGSTPRGPDGRFLASPSSASPPPTDRAHTREAGAEDPAPPPPPTGRFKFAGEEYASQAEAEQQVKSLRGQYKPIHALARSLGGIEKIPETLTRAADSARGWKAEHDRVAAELAEYRQPGRSAAASSTTAPDSTPAPEADVDWELYAEVKKLATESGEPWKAEQWLINETRKIERARFDKTLDERFEPIRQQQAQQEVDSRTSDLFGGLAEYTMADGSPAFPELHVEATAYEIGKLWASMGLPPESALTTQGAIAAIALYRMLAPARPSPQAKSAGSPSPSTPRLPSPPPSTDTQSAAGLVDGRPTVASVPGAGAPSAEAARIIAGLRSVRGDNRTSRLGFEA